MLELLFIQIYVSHLEKFISFGFMFGRAIPS